MKCVCCVLIASGGTDGGPDSGVQGGLRHLRHRRQWEHRCGRVEPHHDHHGQGDVPTGDRRTHQQCR